MNRLVSHLAAAVVVAASFAWLPSASAQTQAPPAPAAARAPCTDCGVVQSVQWVEQKGNTSGLGLVAGGVVGGVLGHQVGGGTGKTLATIGGAAGGAYVGNKIEQKKNTKGYWSVAIKMDGGQNRTFTYTNQPTVHQGERVKLVDGGKRLALVAN
jgi:outer membrane lipoprotein SlyB